MTCTNLFKQAEADAAALGISVREALALEFVARAALAHMGRNVKAEAIFTVAGQHAAGNMDGETMHQCFQVIDALSRARQLLATA